MEIFADIKLYILIHGFYRQLDVVCRKKKRFIFLLNKDLCEYLTSGMNPFCQRSL